MQNELFNLLDHEHLSEAAILIMANKQDLKDAMTVKEMSDVLVLHTIKRHDWHIQVLSSKPHLMSSVDQTAPQLLLPQSHIYREFPSLFLG